MGAAANGARGDAVVFIDGAPRTLRLTLGALAELETAFEAADMAGLTARLRKLSAADLLVVLGALLRGGGEIETARSLPECDVDPAEAARAIALAFERAGRAA